MAFKYFYVFTTYFTIKYSDFPFYRSFQTDILINNQQSKLEHVLRSLLDTPFSLLMFINWCSFKDRGSAVVDSLFIVVPSVCGGLVFVPWFLLLFLSI